MYRANGHLVLAVVFELTRSIIYQERRVVPILCEHGRRRTVFVTLYGIIVR
jgi:hypothetical protein